MKNIAIIGVGGVGGYFGGKLTTLLESHEDLAIYFIARGEHLRQIKSKGLCLKTKLEGIHQCYPTQASEQIEDLPCLDACLIAVKAYDLESVLWRLKDKIKEETAILPLLNGVDIVSRIRKVIQKGRVYPACVFVGTHIEAPGVVSQNGGACTILLGKDEQYAEEKPIELLNWLKEANIRYEWQQQVQQAIWEKYLFVGAYSLVEVYFNQTMGQLYETPEKRQLVYEVMCEIAKVGRKVGIRIKEEDIQKALKKALDFPYEAKTSFHRDYEKKVRDERTIFAEAMIEMAEAYQISVPLIEKIYKTL